MYNIRPTHTHKHRLHLVSKRLSHWASLQMSSPATRSYERARVLAGAKQNKKNRRSRLVALMPTHGRCGLWSRWTTFNIHGNQHNVETNHFLQRPRKAERQRACQPASFNHLIVCALAVQCMGLVYYLPTNLPYKIAPNGSVMGK